jgi:hypothetical protein
MPTKQQLENKRAELEQWLRDNPTHPNAVEVRQNLNLVVKDIIGFEHPRTFERDTFDITDVEINSKQANT